MKRIVNDKIMNHIRTNPYDSEYLRCECAGLRSYTKFKSDNRIVFAICKECRENGFENVNNCEDCDEITDNTIMLFAFGGHDIYDWLGKKRKKALKKAKKQRRKMGL